MLAIVSNTIHYKQPITPYFQLWTEALVGHLAELCTKWTLNKAFGHPTGDVITPSCQVFKGMRFQQVWCVHKSLCAYKYIWLTHSCEQQAFMSLKGSVPRNFAWSISRDITHMVILTCTCVGYTPANEKPIISLQDHPVFVCIHSVNVPYMVKDGYEIGYRIDSNYSW